MSYYGAAYNSYGRDRPIRIGDRVEVVERGMARGDIDVLYTGTVEGLDNRKATGGYTVMVRPDDVPGLGRHHAIAARPDELRQIAAPGDIRTSTGDTQ
jgi:hypothetical protein